MRPRLTVVLTPNERQIANAWSRYMLAVALAIGAGVIVSSMFLPRSDEALVAATEERPMSPACTVWHAAAGDSAADLARSAEAEEDFRRVNEIVFKLRRGLRNCQAGWLKLACEDFRTVVHARPDPASPFSFACADFVQDEITAGIRLTE